MRVVLDTNVLLSGLLTPGVCEAILDRCVTGDGPTLVICEHILVEFVRHAQGKFQEPPEKVQAAVAYLRGHAELVEPVPVPVEVFPDHGDLPVLGAAVAARADALVTGDRQLLELQAYQGIPILSPRAFYERLRRVR